MSRKITVFFMAVFLTVSSTAFAKKPTPPEQAESDPNYKELRDKVKSGDAELAKGYNDIRDKKKAMRAELRPLRLKRREAAKNNDKAEMARLKEEIQQAEKRHNKEIQKALEKIQPLREKNARERYEMEQTRQRALEKAVQPKG